MEILKFNIDQDRRNLVSDKQEFKVNFKNSPNWIQAREYENQMRQVQVRVVHGDNSPFDLTDVNPMLEGLMPDNTHRIIDNKHGVMLDPQNGVFRFDFPAPVFAVSGSYKQIFFRLWRHSKNIATLEFSMEVLADKVIDGLIPRDYVTPLEDIYDKMMVIYKDADGKFKTQIAAWQQQVTKLLTGLNGDYASMQTTITNLNTQLATLTDKIKANGLLTQSDFSPLQQEIEQARQPADGKVYQTLGKRLAANDDATQKLSKATSSLSQNAVLTTTHIDLAQISLLKKIERPADSSNVFQTAQIDAETGYIYTAEQTDKPGTQTINRYDQNGALLQSHNLNLNTMVWFEGNSLYHNAQNDHVMFILPADLSGNWFIYDFDADTKSDTFKLMGQVKYCIDDQQRYFVVLQGPYGLNGTNWPVQGIILYDLASVIKHEPKITAYIPLKDSLVRGKNKIQGLQMIGDNFYFSRGSTDGWLRTTVVNRDGVLTDDFNWDRTNLNQLLQLDGAVLESEGMSWIKSADGTNVPVSLILGYCAGKAYYILLEHNDPAGELINYRSGVSVASLTRQTDFGAVKGLAFTVNANADANNNLLTQLLNIKELGAYTFTAAEGNAGLAPEMASASGIAIVRQMGNYQPTKIAVIAIDYHNITWTIYYDSGEWSRWAQTSGYTTLWSGYSNLTNAVTLKRELTPYRRLFIAYTKTTGGSGIAWGDKNGVLINDFNNDDQQTGISLSEAQIVFPTAQTAKFKSSNRINLAASGKAASGTAIISRNAAKIVITKIGGIK